MSCSRKFYAAMNGGALQPAHGEEQSPRGAAWQEPAAAGPQGGLAAEPPSRLGRLQPWHLDCSLSQTLNNRTQIKTQGLEREKAVSKDTQLIGSKAGIKAQSCPKPKPDFFFSSQPISVFVNHASSHGKRTQWKGPEQVTWWVS